jgi:hypothetical protein
MVEEDYENMMRNGVVYDCHNAHPGMILNDLLFDIEFYNILI